MNTIKSAIMAIKMIIATLAKLGEFLPKWLESFSKWAGSAIVALILLSIVGSVAVGFSQYREHVDNVRTIEEQNLRIDSLSITVHYLGNALIAQSDSESTHYGRINYKLDALNDNVMFLRDFIVKNNTK